MNKTNIAARRLVAIKLIEQRRILGELRKLRRSTTPANEKMIVATPIGGMSRKALLNMAEKAYMNSVQSVCRARREVFWGVAPPALKCEIS